MRRHVRSTAVVGLLLLLVSGGVGQLLTASDVERFIVPDATDIQVQARGFWHEAIVFRAATPNYSWYVRATRILGAEGWSAPVDSRVRLQVSPSVYWRLRAVGPIYLSERIALRGDPDRAQILITRAIVIPWRQTPWQQIQRGGAWVAGFLGGVQP